MLKQYPKYKFILAFCDYVLLLASWSAAVLLRFNDVPVAELIARPIFVSQAVFIVSYSLIWIIVFQHFNLYKLNLFLSVSDQIVAIIKALAYGLVGLIFLSFFIKGMDWVDSRAVLAYFIAIGFSSITLFRTIVFRKLFVLASQKKILHHKVLIVGRDQTAKMVAAQIAFDDSHGLEVAGFVDDDSATGERVFDDHNVVGRVDQLGELVSTYDIEEIIIAKSDVSHQELLEIIDIAKDTTANVRLVSELYNIIPEKLLLEKYIGVPIVRMPQNDESILFSVYKRVFDVLLTFVALIVLSVPLLVIAILIKLSSRGPVFFNHTRIGKNGKPFEFYKFRTMYLDNDDTAHREFVDQFIQQGSGTENEAKIQKITDDPRVTKIGRFLRKTSLDELPQLINVMQGKMSLVGPRPCLPYELELYQNWHRRRLSVIPGCTGLWQVSGRSTVDFNDMVILDLFYIDNMSPLFDLKIILRTIPVMLLAKGGH